MKCDRINKLDMNYLILEILAIFRTFTCNMHAFGLSRTLCLEFLRKQCVIANLTKGKVIFEKIM